MRERVSVESVLREEILPLFDKSPEELLNELRSFRVLVAGDEVSGIFAKVSEILCDLYERAIKRGIRDRGIYPLSVLRLPRVGKKIEEKLEETEEREHLRSKILKYFVFRENLYLVLEKDGPRGELTNGIPNLAVGVPIADSQRGDSLPSAALFRDSEEKSQTELKKILSDLAFRYYYDWCGKELGFGREFIKNLERISSMTTLELIDLKLKVREISFAAEGSRFEEPSRKILRTLERVINDRLRASRGKRSGSEDTFSWIAQFPEVFTSKVPGFDLIVLRISGGRSLSKKVMSCLELLKSGGKAVAELPETFLFHEEWKEVRAKVSGKIKRVERSPNKLIVVLEGAPVQASQGEGTPLILGLSDRERRTIDQILSRFPLKVGDLFRIEPGLRIRRLSGEEGTMDVLLPENISLYRVSGRLKKLNLNVLKENLKERALNLAVPKVAVSRKSDFSSLPVPHLKITASADNEGLIPTDGVLCLLPLEEERVHLSVMAAYMNSILFGWLLHRLSFGLTGAPVNLTPYSLSLMPISDILFESHRIRELSERLTTDGFNPEVFSALEEEILLAFGFSPEDMPLSYRKLLSEPEVVKI
jgi:hypothetical protein